MDAVHIHLLLNHIPVIGSLFAVVLFVFSIIRKNYELKRLSLVLFVLAALVAVPVYLTGEPAEEAVENLAGVSHSILEQHEDTAQIAMILLAVTGALSLLGLFLMKGGKELARWLVLALLASSAAAGVLMARTANLGGQIRHTEIRADNADVRQTESKGDATDHDDH